MYSKIYKDYKFYPVIYNDKKLIIGNDFMCNCDKNSNKFIMSHFQDTEFSFMKKYGEKFKIYIIALNKKYSKECIFKYFNSNYRDKNIKLINSITFNYNNYNYFMNTISYKENLLTIYELRKILYHILPDELINIIYNYIHPNNIKFNCSISLINPKRYGNLRFIRDKCYLVSPELNFNLNWFNECLSKF